MRKPKILALLIVTIVFAAFTLGFFLGNRKNRDGITVSVSHSFMTMPTLESVDHTDVSQETVTITFPICVNQAGKEEFMALPGIGDVLAQRIVDYRLENGSFSTLEELLNVEGIGKKRLEEIMDMITLGG